MIKIRILRLNERIEALSPPCFIACAASVHPRPGADGTVPSLTVESMQDIPRHARDRWIIGVARRTIAALEAGGGATPETLADLAGAMEQALASVDPVQGGSHTPPQDHIDATLDTIRATSVGRTGADADEVMTTLSSLGISGTAAKACIHYLIEEGDCYCPHPGRLRLL